MIPNTNLFKFSIICVIITTVHAYTISRMSKPIMDLDKWPIPTKISPEERRKLSIFPKNPIKYIVTSPPYAKVRMYTSRPILMAKNPFVNINPIYQKSAENYLQDQTVTSHSLLDFDISMSPPVQQKPQQMVGEIINDDTVEIETSDDDFVESQSDLRNDNDLDFIGEESEEISTDIPEIDETQSDENVKNNNDQIIETDLDNVRIKRLAISGPALYSNWNFKTIKRAPSDASYELDDKNEYIFVKDYERKYSRNNNTSTKSTENVENAVEVSTSSVPEGRLKRSNNVIEEENMGTTISGFKYTGREQRLSNYVAYKNINV